MFNHEALPTITPELMAVGRVLHERHPYSEDPDGFQWWAWDAKNMLDMVETRSDLRGAIRQALIDSGLHYFGSDGLVYPDQRACFETDVQTLAAHFGATGEQT